MDKLKARENAQVDIQIAFHTQYKAWVDCVVVESLPMSIKSTFMDIKRLMSNLGDLSKTI